MHSRPLLFALATGTLAAQSVADPPRPPASAQRPPAPREGDDDAAPREIASTISLSAEGRPVDVARTPGRIRVFRAEEIAQSGARTLGEFLAGVIPGQAQGSGQPGMPSTPYQGGSRPQDTLVTLDGLPLTDSTLRGADLNQVPLIGIDRIEVLEGAASSRFGTHAMGGAVALYSAGSTGAGGHGEIATRGGSGRQRQGGVAPGYGWDSGWIRLGSIYDEENPLTETGRPYRLGTAFLGFGQRLGDAASFTFSYRNFLQSVPMPFERATPLERVFDQDRLAEVRGNQALAALRVEAGRSFAWEVRAGLVTLHRDEPDDDTGGVQPFRSRRGQFALGLHWTPAPRFGLSLGVDLQEERAVQPSPLGREEQGRTRSAGLALEARWDLTPSLRLLANLRQDAVDQRYTGPDGQSLELGRYHPFSAKVGLNQALGYGFRIFALAGTGYNTPLLAQSLVNARERQPLLQAEKAVFYQVGLGWELGRLSMRLETGRTRYEELIYPLTADAGLPRQPQIRGAFAVPAATGFANGGAYRHQGAEATVGYRTAWRIPVGFDAFVRNQEARDLNAAPGHAFGTPLVQNRPFTTHGFRLYAAGTKVRVETRWNRVGRRYESVHSYQCSDLEPLVTPTFVSYDDLTVTTTYSYSRLFSVILRGEHLAQKNISVTDWQGRKTDLADNAALVYGIPAPKPSVTVELRFRY